MRGLWSKTTFEVFYNVISVTFTHLHSRKLKIVLFISVFFSNLYSNCLYVITLMYMRILKPIGADMYEV